MEKKLHKTEDSKIIFGMVLLQDDNTFDVDVFCKDFEVFYDSSIQEPTGDNSSFVFKSDGETIVIAHMPVPIPSGDIEGTALYAYNWQNALDETKAHKSHLIVSLMQGGQDQIKRFKLFTKILCSLLRITNSIGVYEGNQSLLLPKDDYLREAALMSENYLPLNLWIYFGLRKTEKGQSGYTYGMREFNKMEMEVLSSSKSLEDIRGFLFNIAHYVLDYDVIFQDGQTCGISEEDKIPISISKGKFVDCDTLKLAY